MRHTKCQLRMIRSLERRRTIKVYKQIAKIRKREKKRLKSTS